MISWFGIRGIGSVFYLMFAIQHGVTGPLAQPPVTFTRVTLAASIVVHGVAVTPPVPKRSAPPVTVRCIPLRINHSQRNDTPVSALAVL